MRNLRTLLVLALVAALPAAQASVSSVAEADPEPVGAEAPVVVARSGPLTGTTIVLDPGHQLGNHNFPAQIRRPVPAGGFRKPCNTTGTATNRGYPEATFNWQVAVQMRERLQALGARVVLTRSTNRQDRWGPCVDVRGRAGNRLEADLKISIHADGSATGRGFHVIAPTDRPRWTRDIYRPSLRLAKLTRAALLAQGLRVANYTARGRGLALRGDLGTLNLSDVPTVMLEAGNMRHRADAYLLSRPDGQRTIALALVTAARRYLGR